MSLAASALDILTGLVKSVISIGSNIIETLRSAHHGYQARFFQMLERKPSGRIDLISVLREHLEEPSLCRPPKKTLMTENPAWSREHLEEPRLMIALMTRLMILHVILWSPPKKP